MNNRYSDEHWLMQCRLKTARRKKRLVKEAHEKMLRNLYKMRQDISNQIHNLGWEELHPPYQRGWKRTFILKPEMARSKHAIFYEKLLEKINTIKYSDRKDFKKKKRVRRKRVYMPVKQSLQALDERAFKKLAEPEQLHFTKTNVWCNCANAEIIQYVFTEPNRFYSLKVQPNMITRLRRRSVLLESSLAEIELKIERNNLNPQMCRLMHGHYQYWGWKMNEKAKYKNSFRNWPLQKIIEDGYQ